MIFTHHFSAPLPEHYIGLTAELLDLRDAIGEFSGLYVAARSLIMRHWLANHELFPGNALVVELLYGCTWVRGARINY